MATDMSKLGVVEGLGMTKDAARGPRVRPRPTGGARPGAASPGGERVNWRFWRPEPAPQPGPFRGQKTLPGPDAGTPNWQFYEPPPTPAKDINARVLPNREGVFGRIADLGDYLRFEGRNLDPGLQRSGIPGLTKHPRGWDRYMQLWASRGLRAASVPLRILGNHPRKTIAALGTAYGLNAIANAGPRAHIPSPPWQGSVINYTRGGRSPWM